MVYLRAIGEGSVVAIIIVTAGPTGEFDWVLIELFNLNIEIEKVSVRDQVRLDALKVLTFKTSRWQTKHTSLLASVAQSAERQSHNLKVESSNLPRSNITIFV